MRYPRPCGVILTVVSLAFLSACGHEEAPAGPTRVLSSWQIPAGTVLSIVSGETDLPIAGAAVVVAGRSYETDAAGQVRLAEAVGRGALVDVVAAGFFDRQTRLRSAEETGFSLWPRTSATGLDEQTTKELVYTSGSSCCPAENLASRGLYRVHPAIARFDVVLDERYRARRNVVAAVEEGESLAGAASGARVVFHPTESATGLHIEITTGPDPLDRPNVAAFADLDLDRQGYITGGRVVFVMEEYLTGHRSWRSVATVVAHELGHFLGLGHSTAPGLMSVVDGRAMNFAFFAATGDFSPGEKLALSLMYQRRAGTRFPDNDRQAAASSVRRVRIVCAL